MAAVTCVCAIEFYLGGVWVDVSADVRIVAAPIHASYGIKGSTLTDRVASTGTMTFALDNTTHNSGGVQGYYSTFNANCRAGFMLGIGVRLKITFGGTDYYKFRGRLDAIDPLAGKYRDQYVQCTAVDWMDQAARWRLSGLAAQINQRADQLISTIVAAMPATTPASPAAQSLATGYYTFPYALDSSVAQKATALSEFGRIVQSELGFLYVRGNTTGGETLQFESRTTRVLKTTNDVTLDESMVELAVPTRRDDVINFAQATVYPRRVDGGAVVLWSQVGNAPVVAAGQVVTIRGNYRDPNLLAASVGGTSMVAPAATTDYTANTAMNGTGADLTGSFTVTATFDGNSAVFTVTNTGAADGYLTKLQCRGIGLYSYVPVVAEKQDAASQGQYGQRVLQYDMPYQADSVVAFSLVQAIIDLYKQPQMWPRTVAFQANTESALMTAALAQEIGTRIGIRETVTGVTDVVSGSPLTRGFFINAVDLVITAGQNLKCTWTVTPADGVAGYWLVGVAGSSELGSTTKLYYA